MPFRFKSIQTTIMLSFFLLVLSSLFAFLVISLRFSERDIISNSTEYTGQLIRQVNSEMDSYISYMENIADMVTKSTDVQGFLFHGGIQDDIWEERYERLIGQFQTVLNTRSDIRNIAVIGDDGTCAINRGNTRLNPYVSISEQDWYQEAKKEWYQKENKDERYVLSSSHIQNVIANRYDWVITLSKAVVNSQTKKIEGVFFIDMNYRSIDDLCKGVSLGDKGYIYVLDKQGNIIYHPQQQLIYSGLKKEEIQKVKSLGDQGGSFLKGQASEKKVYTVVSSGKTGWTVVGVSYMSELMRNRVYTQAAYILMAAVLMAAAAILSVLLSNRITRPLRRLDVSMKEIGQGNFEAGRIEVHEENEIGRLGSTFNIMVGEIQRLMRQNVQEQKEKRKAEIRALQSQINPHFLYNTLDSIIWMAESGKHNQEVVIMTSALSKLFRRSIGNPEELVTIRQELEYTETYLTIQRIRYRDQLEFAIQGAPSIMEERIVKFTLQPLVENAIYHGIKYAEHGGVLTIRGYRMNGEILLKVIDNGKGMTREECDHVLDEHEPDKRGKGIGVYNVQRRLQLYYGKEFGLTYDSGEDRGTTVTVRIPVRKDEEVWQDEPG